MSLTHLSTAAQTKQLQAHVRSIATPSFPADGSAYTCLSPCTHLCVRQLETQGDLVGAERLHLQALKLKEKELGLNHITTAISWNAMGELYIKLETLADAEEYLNKALRVRKTNGPASDAAVTRDNLAQISEMRGQLQKARDMRLSGAPKNLTCSNHRVYCMLFRIHSVLITSNSNQCLKGTVISLDQLSTCGTCMVCKIS